MSWLPATCARLPANTFEFWSPVIVFDRLLWDTLSIDERRAVHQPAAAHVDQQPTGGHRRQLAGADEVVGRGGQRSMQDHDVGGREQLVERDDRGGVVGARRRVGGDDPGAEPGQLARGQPPDPPVADDPAEDAGL